jgi:hypothetical protein
VFVHQDRDYVNYRIEISEHGGSNQSFKPQLMKQRQTYSWKAVRVDLGMHCHWVFIVRERKAST